jgi:F0F1-type ATP synthase assembly protein I
MPRSAAGGGFLLAIPNPLAILCACVHKANQGGEGYVGEANALGPGLC